MELDSDNRKAATTVNLCPGQQVEMDAAVFLSQAHRACKQPSYGDCPATS